MVETGRTLIAKHGDLAARYRHYLVPGKIEIEERSSFEVRKRWVLLEETRLMTLHRLRRWMSPMLFLVLGVFWSMFSLAAVANGDFDAMWFGLFVAFLPVIPAIVLFFLPLYAITVDNPRSSTRLVFGRRSKARDWFARLSREIESTQRRGGAEEGLL